MRQILAWRMILQACPSQVGKYYLPNYTVSSTTSVFHQSPKQGHLLGYSMVLQHYSHLQKILTVTKYFQIFYLRLCLTFYNQMQRVGTSTYVRRVKSRLCKLCPWSVLDEPVLPSLTKKGQKILLSLCRGSISGREGTFEYSFSQLLEALAC